MFGTGKICEFISLRLDDHLLHSQRLLRLTFGFHVLLKDELVFAIIADPHKFGTSRQFAFLADMSHTHLLFAEFTDLLISYHCLRF